MRCILSVSVTAAAWLIAACSGGDGVVSASPGEMYVEVGLGSAIYREITLTNNTELEVVVTGSISSCTCVTTAVKELRVPSGGSRIIPVKIEGRAVGVRDETLRLRTDSINSPVCEVAVHVSVGPAAQMVPEDIVISLSAAGEWLEVAAVSVIGQAQATPPSFDSVKADQGLEAKMGEVVVRSLGKGVNLYRAGVLLRAGKYAMPGVLEAELHVQGELCGEGHWSLNRPVTATVRRRRK